MGLITKPWTFSAGASIIANEYNANFDTLYNKLNGGLDNTNFATGGINGSQLATITTAGKVNLSALVATSQATGDIIYKGASGYARLPIGSTGQKLKIYDKYIDAMEYSSDANAQAAYVTNDVNYIPTNSGFETWSAGDTNPPTGWSLFGGVTAAKEISTIYIGTYSAKLTRATTDGGMYQSLITGTYTIAYWNGKTITLGIWVYATVANRARLVISDNGGDGYSSYHTGDSTWQFLTVTKTLTVTDTVNIVCRVDSGDTSAYCDGAMVSIGNSAYTLQSYSESTIKTQGSYSLKGVASATVSLNKTLAHTFATNQNLAGVNTLKLDMRASRTGANVKLGIHDTGGTTTELTPTISSANTYQTFTWDLSGVADADKNNIDKLIITVVNADAANTVYLDNFYDATSGVLKWVTP